MAAAEVTPRPCERQAHRRPFSTWLKRVTTLNKSHTASRKAKKSLKNNNPYPQSGINDHHAPSDSSQSNSYVDSYATPPSRHDASRESYSSHAEDRNGEDMYACSRSNAPTVATRPETIHSDAGYSRALTGTTAGGALSSINGGGANSTFSSPNQSTHSLTTTLTTIQSSNALNPNTPTNPANHNSNTNTTNPSAAQTPVQFTHQYPITASAIPSHLQTPAQQPHQPTTYASATSNNLLTDNASILTLASSSKRRRRSMDTDASVRAMAPHSIWGDSRESLPLSVLNAATDSNQPMTSAPAVRPNALMRDERASVYSSQGVAAPALVSERNSFYAASHKAATTHRDSHAPASAVDGVSLRGYEGSIRSGALGHARNESSSGSPLASPSLLRRPSGAISLDVRDDGVKEDDQGEAA